MTITTKLVEIVLDCVLYVLVAASLYLTFLGLRLLWHWGIRVRHAPHAPVDPVDTAVWDVLAEARHITEQGDDRGQSR
jgi:hypothetical protein